MANKSNLSVCFLENLRLANLLFKIIWPLSCLSFFLTNLRPNTWDSNYTPGSMVNTIGSRSFPNLAQESPSPLTTISKKWHRVLGQIAKFSWKGLDVNAIYGRQLAHEYIASSQSQPNFEVADLPIINLCDKFAFRTKSATC